MTWKWMLVALASVAMTVTPAASASAPTLTKKHAELLFKRELRDRSYADRASDDYIDVDCRRLTAKRYKCKAEWLNKGDDHMTGSRGYVIRYSRGTDVTVSEPYCVSGCETWDD